MIQIQFFSWAYIFRYDGDSLKQNTMGNRRIDHEWECGIQKSEQKTTVWHREACLVITKGDLEGKNFQYLSHIDDSLILPTIKYRVFILNKKPPRRF